MVSSVSHLQRFLFNGQLAQMLLALLKGKIIMAKGHGRGKPLTTWWPKGTQTVGEEEAGVGWGGVGNTPPGHVPSDVVLQLDRT